MLSVKNGENILIPHYTGDMSRKKTLKDERRVEILLPNELLITVEKEAKILHASRSEIIRRILIEYFAKDTSVPTSYSIEDQSIGKILNRLDEMGAKLNSINARVKSVGKRARR